LAELREDVDLEGVAAAVVEEGKRGAEERGFAETGAAAWAR